MKLIRLLIFKVIPLFFCGRVFISVAFTQDLSHPLIPLYKNQKNSVTKWDKLNYKKFLSLKEWKDESDERDQVPEWESIVRERNNREIVGRFFQCSGHCRVEHGAGFFNASYRSAIFEGDEVLTSGDSYAWIFLFDGTMVRLSPESSINFNEINIGKKENFLNARINAGNVLWLSRYESLFEEVNNRETDVLFFPLSMYEAQPIMDKRSYNEDQLIESLEENKTVFNQYVNLNKLIASNNLFTLKKPTYAFIVAPNVTFMGHNPSLEIVSLLGGKTFFKNRSYTLLGLREDAEKDIDKISNEILIQKRGFENSTLVPLENDKWMVMDEKGRNLEEANEHTYWLQMGEFITKYIPSIMVARELMLTKYSEFAFREKINPEKLAKNDGYRLWGSLKNANQKDDLELRLDFLKEYFRRIETTNLLVLAHFSERLREKRELVKSMEYGNFFFIKALDKYYSFENYATDNDLNSNLNSKSKVLWKHLHGIK